MSPELEDAELREECGVIGVCGTEDAAILTALGLHALQHRGEEACGVAVWDGERFYNERHMGLVGDNFGGADLPARLPGHVAIGHNRYSTQGKPAVRNIQPIFADLAFGGFAVAHNGNLTNSRELRRELVGEGAIFQSTMDTEAILHLLAHSTKPRVTDRLVDALARVEGGFALVGLSEDTLFGARDPVGLRPLVLGKRGEAYILASETCALDAVGAKYVRDVENGELVVITAEGVESLRFAPPRPASPCVFEYVYFSRPDSKVGGRSVYEVRRRMGQRLAEDTPVEADVVVPVPDSGVPAAIGYAERSGLPFQLGIIRSHYVGRTFIQPTQAGRQLSISRKHSPNAAAIEGKRVVLIDDSIVRGNTSRKIVEMVRAAGAREVHFRSASPMITHPDFYGIDMPSREELFAARCEGDLERMRRELGVESLGFLSVDGLYDAIGAGGRDGDAPQFADHCFTGAYPTRLVDHEHAGSAKELQLSLLEEI